MHQSWFISDTHFSHKGMIAFKDKEGRPLRPFSTVEEMDETMVSRWNERVRPNDRVYHLGDVVINRKALGILGRLNGKKVLVAGNHDIFKLSDYTKYFEDKRGYKIFPEWGLICSHMPVHPSQMERRWRRNAHGHMHSNHVMRTEYVFGAGDVTDKDPRYVNICVEQTNYAPISFEELLIRCGLDNKINAETV